ncbi:MAG: HupE/UreJ family protein [Burkholderiaceae bacterium]|nr:HupE/UreJ family protein [Burkholderiaceae bacterium]
MKRFAVLGLALAFSPAHAHLQATGMGPVYDGITHFVTSPEDLLVALALALLSGLRGAAYSRRAVFTLPAAWFVGSLLGLGASASSVGNVGAGLLFLALGGLVVADAKVSQRALVALCALVGLLQGYFNGTGMGWSGPAILAALAIMGAVFVLVVLAAALVVQVRAHWGRIAVRVAGSWIAASGVLMLGWAMRG